MAATVIRFPDIPWLQGGHPLERKKTEPGSRATFLEFLPGFVDPNWCSRGHVGYVLSGTLRFECRDISITIEEGEGFQIDPGTEHRAGNPGTEPVVVFLVSW